MNHRLTLPLSLLLASAAYAAPGGELTTNGGFEAGDTSSWQNFAPAGSTFDLTMDAATGSFAGVITNTTAPSGHIIKQANIGIGSVQPGDPIRISFAAKGSFAVGGVAFVEFFSEIDGGGVSSAELLGGGPLPLTDEYQNFCFTTVAGPDVSGGVTLQVGAITGAAMGSTSQVFIDNASVTIEELGTNGDFELGDTSSWQSFPTATSTFDATMDANSGSFGGRIVNNDQAAAHVVKQANVGIGIVQPGDTLNVSFAAKGTFGVGGVCFAEFFSELDGGGTSAAELLGGAPVPLTADWQTFNFTVTAGPDVSGGVTLQLVAVTGAVTGSSADVSLDDVSITTTSGAIINYCTSSPNSTGSAAVMSSTGSPSVSAEDFVIQASGLPAGSFALFFVGMDTANAPSFDGTMCIGGGCRIGPIMQADGAGTISRDMPSSVYAQFGCTAPVVGSRMLYQAVYRDTVGSGGNWTDGLCVVFGQ